MTRLTAQTRIENRLGQRTGLGPRIQDELLAAQSHFEKAAFLPWFLKIASTFAQSEPTFMLPVGYLREVDDESLLSIVTATGVTELSKQSYQFLMRQEGMVGLGTPRFYSVESDQNYERPLVYLFPQPETSYTIRMVYYRADVELVADSTENRWLTYTPDLLISYAGLQMAKALRSPEAVTLFTADLADSIKAMYHGHVAQDMAARDLTMGG